MRNPSSTIGDEDELRIQLREEQRHIIVEEVDDVPVGVKQLRRPLELIF